jgi:hypothetical protein
LLLPQREQRTGFVSQSTTRERDSKLGYIEVTGTKICGLGLCFCNGSPAGALSCYLAEWISRLPELIFHRRLLPFL